MKFFFIVVHLFFSISILISCKNPNHKEVSKPKSIDYTDQKVLVDIIKETPYSRDTLFLGFAIGMTKSEFKKQLKKLRSEGKKIKFSDSNIISTFGGKIEIGEGYIFETSISTEWGNKTFTGRGEYILQTKYNGDNKLIELTVLPIENWNEDYGMEIDKPKWFKNKVIENSETFKNGGLMRAMLKKEIIREGQLIRQKDNLVIYDDDFSIHYLDLKTLLKELLIKETEKKIIKENNKNIKF